MLRKDDLDLMRRGKGSSGEETDTAGVVGEEPGEVYELATLRSDVVFVVVAVGIGGGGEVVVSVVVGAVAGEVVDPENMARMDTKRNRRGRISELSVWSGSDCRDKRVESCCVVFGFVCDAMNEGQN